MPDKLYQECRALISGCRAIFEDLREAGIDTLALSPKRITVPVNVSNKDQTSQVLANTSSNQETLVEIQKDLDNCQRCDLREECRQTVLGVGNTNARLVLVGDAPDSQAERQEEPFAGAAGQLLDRILYAMKLTREDVYICNQVKCRPPNDREPVEAEITSCESFLKRQLVAISPEIILSLGLIATQALLQIDAPISSLRGRWQSYAGIPLMPTFHPAYLLVNPAGKHQVWEDVKQVMHRLQDTQT